MRFELDINRRDLSDETLIKDLVRVANQLQTKSPTTEQYAEHGQFHRSTFIRRFGDWRAGLLRAGLNPGHQNRIDPDEALADLRKVADLIKRNSVAAREYEIHGKFSPGPFARLFGSWNNALSAAGLKPSKRAYVSDDELFQNLERMWRTLGRQPSYGEVTKPFSDFSSGTYERHFGGWRKALEAFVEFANAPSSEEPATEEVAFKKETNLETVVRSPHRRSTSRTVNWRLRFLVMRRDGFRCRACGASPATELSVRLHVDHILAWSLGGETVFENLQTLCETCNIGKSNVAGVAPAG